MNGSGRTSPSLWPLAVGLGQTSGAVRRALLFHLYFNGMRHWAEPEVSIETWLRRHGINPTRQRLEIARVLFASPAHMSADRILALVNERRPATSKATVYNTLKLFLERGLIREVIADPNKVFFDSNTSHHFHFYDVDSGELTDIHADGVKVTGLPPLPEGVVTEGLDIVVRIRSKAGA